MFLIGIVIICAFLHLLLKWNYSYWQRDGVPGPNPSILTGNIGPAIAQKKHLGMLADDWYKKFSNLPFIGYYNVLTPAIMIRDVELIKNVLIRDFTSFLANERAINYDPHDMIAENPFFQTDEQKWKLSRSIMSPMFTTNKMKSIFPLMKKPCDSLIKYINQEGSEADHEAKSLSAKFTTENVASCVFSLEANCFDDLNSEFRRMGRTLFKPSFWLGIKFTVMQLLPFFERLFRVSFIPKPVAEWAKRLVKENVKSRQHRELDCEDMLQILLDSQDKFSISLNQIAGHAVSLFVEGFETSSSVLSFALWEIARHEEIQQKVYEEIKRVLEKHKNTLSYEAISEMEYLDLVIQETQRVNTLFPVMKKVCTKPYEMPKLPGQKQPTILQPGTTVLIPVYSLHNDPEFYPCPEIFNPHRFTEEERQSRPKCTFLPFGDGPRICIGMKFGILQTKMALVSILSHFKIKKSPSCQQFAMDMRSLALQSRNGLILRFEKRK
ncbi:probable cytochrome P450 6a13 [Phlebotomus argentipes]|uniref:probable cytochrome P450 6a13 n=1 Tax=Phlebotomus argentipes TaxID=94469 RepID=UPI002892FBC7|nr:probable cytochrome P450 6a13 [Phlebotomus argentipes]